MAVRLGANAYFEKLYNPEIILSALDKAVRNYRALLDGRTDSLTRFWDRKTIRSRIDAYISYIAGKEIRAALGIICVENLSIEGEALEKSADALVTFAQILQKYFPRRATIGRLNINEFVVLFRGLIKNAEIEEIIKHVVSEFGEVFGDDSAAPTISAGLTVFDGSVALSSTIFQETDFALKKARNYGRNQYAFFEPDHDHIVVSTEAKAARLLDEIGAFVYVCDVKTNEKLFANSRALSLCEGTLPCSKCVCSILGLDEQYGLCSKTPLSKHKFEINTIKTKDKLYNCRMKLIEWYGKLARLMIITEEQSITYLKKQKGRPKTGRPLNYDWGRKSLTRPPWCLPTP
ncbi:MAG: GGDEF domain-containing protein [Ruminococcaceae bacterium]|nr:GGDEF domain-containing protein [Oscillospiraceae bacterium]